ncbi:hypothetical protein BDV33DRAFT_198901 [Aspergillus novoparasiticus]|uniref:Uncharacterized protein n=1 Tax=Aspergillus novoparasiticus TaxID=986946 RepID=A0A5N6F7M4_9EURO|nr:hypothetical protein BDV33DRAFT_198901 [Aspergillus novoparasiticus]
MFLTTAWLLWLSLFLARSTWGQYGSQLNERDFDIVWQSLNITGHPDYFDNIDGEVELNENDEMVVNATFGIRQNLDDLCYVHVSGYENSNGQDWVLSYEEGDTDLCDFAANHQCIFTELGLHSNLPSRCPYTPKDIQIEGYQLDPNCFPKDMKMASWAVNIVMSCRSPNGTDGEIVEALRVYAQIRVQSR